MKQLTRYDELNNIRIQKYFEEMDLSKNEIDERIALANKFYDAYARALSENDDEIEEDYLFEYLVNEYAKILSSHGYDFKDLYFSDYIDLSVNSVLETTVKTGTITDERFESIAENDANALANHRLYTEQKRNGYMFKRWNTKKDQYVRHTHVEVDGEQIGIDDEFTVGTSKMLYPNDTSLGADASEIINCRCTVEYIK